MAAELRLRVVPLFCLVIALPCIFFCGFLQCSRSQGRTPVKGRGDPEFGSTDTCPEGAFVVRLLGSLPRRVRLCAFCSTVVYAYWDLVHWCCAYLDFIHPFSP